MDNKKTLVLNNQLEEIEKLPVLLEEVCSQWQLPVSVEASLNLVLEEAVVNVIQYAYPEGEEGTLTIEVEWKAEENILQFTLSDGGKPFDPTAVPDADTSLSVEERPIGGLGIFLIRQMMDCVEYRYYNNRNTLVMQKRITAEGKQA